MESISDDVVYDQPVYSLPTVPADEEDFVDYTDAVHNGSYIYNISQFSNTTNDSPDSYDYDYNDSISNIPVEEITLVALVYGFTLVLGVLGNSLVIFTIIRVRRMQSITNIFLTSLASADLMLLFICVPIKFAKWFSFTWDFGLLLCKVVHYLQNVSVVCSVLTLTTMSMERYYAICHPMKAKYKCTNYRARRIITTLWLLSAVLASPIIYGQYHKKVGDKRTGYWCIDDWGNNTLEVGYALYMFFLILVLPLVVMTIAYTAICQELWNITYARSKLQANGTTRSHTQEGHYGTGSTSHLVRHSSHQGDTTTKNNTDRTRKQVIKILVTIIVLFTICWGPTLMDQLLQAFGWVHKLNYGYLKHMRQAFVLMSYFNSCVNPIVYAFMSKHWRQSFTYALCQCSKGRRRGGIGEHGRHMSLMSTTPRTIHRTVPQRQVEETSYSNVYPDNRFYVTLQFVAGKPSAQMPL